MNPYSTNQGVPMNNVATSVIRTVCATVLGYAFAWLLSKGVNIGETERGQITAWFILTSQGVVYAVIRWAEARWPAVGWLLGIAKAPGYSSADAPPAQPAPGNNDGGQGSLQSMAWVLVIVFLVVVLLRLL